LANYITLITIYTHIFFISDMCGDILGNTAEHNLVSSA